MQHGLYAEQLHLHATAHCSAFKHLKLHPFTLQPAAAALPLQWLGSLQTLAHTLVVVGSELCLTSQVGSIIALSMPFCASTFHLPGTGTYSMVSRSMWPLEMVLEENL